MKRVLKKTIAAALAAAMVLSLAPANGAEAAKKPKLSKKKATLVKGKTLKLKVKNGNKKAKVTWKTNKKKIVKITKKSSKGNKATATVKALKKGSAKITASYKLGKKTTKLVCKITVKVKSTSQKGSAATATPGTGTTAPGTGTTAPGTGTTAPGTGTTAPGGNNPGGVSAPPPAASVDPGQATDAPEESAPAASRTPRPPKEPTALPTNSAVEAHKLGKFEEVTVNGKVDKPANGTEWENTTDKEIDLLANKEVSLRGTSGITAAKAFLMWADETDNGENALYAIVKVAKPGTVGASDKVTLFVSEDGTKVEKAEAVVGAAASENGAAAVSKADDLGGVDGYIAELKVPLSKAYTVDTDKLKIDIMITDGDATINYFDTMTEWGYKTDADGNKVVENDRYVAVPSGPAVSVDKDASKMGNAALIASMAAAAKAYYTASGAAIREIADYEKNKWDYEIAAEPAEGEEEPEEPADNVKSKVMDFVPTNYWTDVYKANDDESIAFPNINTDGYNMEGNPSLANEVKDEAGNSIGWEASRDKVQSYVLWDEGYVYVLFDVNDPQITASNNYNGDSVEFFLDQDYSAPATYDVGNGDEVQLRVDAANNAFTADAQGCDGTAKYELVAHAVAYKKGESDYAEAYNAEGVTGYQVEMIIKLQNDETHETPKNTDIMGVDLQVNDCYTEYADDDYEEVTDEWGDTQLVPIPGKGTIKRAATLTAFDTTNNCYQYPNCFGRVKLLGGPEGEGPGGPGGPGEEEADVEATFTNAQITIDGTIDSAWGAAPFIDVKNGVPGGEDTTGTARAKLMWDADNLYVLVVVKDADIDTSCKNDWERDGGEVFLDEVKSKETSYDDNTDAFQYRFTGMPEDGVSEAATHMITAGSEAAKTAYSGIESAYQFITTAEGNVTGYRIEHKIPWMNKAEAGKIVGFELNVFDCSGGVRNRELYMINTENKPLYNDPSHMGTLKLAQPVAKLPWTADLSQIQIDPEDGSTMTVNDDGSVTIVNGGKTYTGGITLNMPAKYDKEPKKCTIYVDCFDADGKNTGGGAFKWGDAKYEDPGEEKYADSSYGMIKGSQQFNWSADGYNDTVLDMLPANVPELPTFLVMNFQDAGRTFKITKIVVE